MSRFDLFRYSPTFHDSFCTLLVGRGEIFRPWDNCPNPNMPIRRTFKGRFVWRKVEWWIHLLGARGAAKLDCCNGRSAFERVDVFHSWPWFEMFEKFRRCEFPSWVFVSIWLSVWFASCAKGPKKVKAVMMELVRTREVMRPATLQPFINTLFRTDWTGFSNCLMSRVSSWLCCYLWPTGIEC